MHLIEAVDAIREKLIEHRISRTTDLWSIILKQIAKQDSFDGKYLLTPAELTRLDSDENPLFSRVWSLSTVQLAPLESVDTVLETIRSFLSQLEDATTIALWGTTEAGYADDSEDDCLFPDSIRIDLEMELLKEVTDLAWNEAKDCT